MKIDIMPKDTNFAFNLSHVWVVGKEVECYIKKVETSVLANMMTYLTSKEAFSLNLVSKQFKTAVTQHWDARLALFISEIES